MVDEVKARSIEKMLALALHRHASTHLSKAEDAVEEVQGRCIHATMRHVLAIVKHLHRKMQ